MSLNLGERSDPTSHSDTMPHDHLPNPQSPNGFKPHIHSVLWTPESPVVDSSYSHSISTSPQQRSSPTKSLTEDTGVIEVPIPHQSSIPGSSPSANPTSRYTSSMTTQPTHPPSRMENSKDDHTRTKLENPITLAPAPHISTSVSSPFEERSSRLSSPFMAKLSIADQASKSRSPLRSRHQPYSPELSPMHVDEIFSPGGPSSGEVGASLPSSGSPPSISPPPQISKLAVGGEMERIRQALMQDRLAHFQEAESRRPDYLKRSKRTLSETDPTAIAEEENARQREREGLVGIMESPHKGRRLKLFQETSEESFEESLMAGGYGRYRTAEWVRQPQPIILATPGPAGPSSLVSTLEKAEEIQPSEKELRKRKRLAAFRQRTSQDGPVTVLHPVELEGKGRVILDIQPEDENNPNPESPRPKKKGGTRKKKKSGALTAKEKKALGVALGGDLLEKPNWPDAEFPWRLRREEQAEATRAEEVEKMRWIEKFLDRESDEEEEEELIMKKWSKEEEHEQWVLYGDGAGQPVRMGRGKMVPLPGNPNVNSAGRSHTLFPTDPADARAALLSKKRVRTLSYRQHRRQRLAEEDSDEEIVCLCHGTDDGRELVQCDGCETWYHLQCIGITDIAELGKEEDPWYCRNCEEYGRLQSREQESLNEPTFVPTDDIPRLGPSYDPPFFQPSLQDSPMPWTPSRMPHTPTRSGQYTREFSSSSSWIDSSRHEPSTPQHPTQHVRVYTHNTPGPFDPYGPDYEESVFDPTSTPSRGITFGAPFTTPKNNVWSTRANGLFHTPSKVGGRQALRNKTFRGPGMLSSTLDDSGGSHGFMYDKLPHHDDESPVRRMKPSDGTKMRRVIESPLASRSFSTTHLPYLFDE